MKEKLKVVIDGYIKLFEKKQDCYFEEFVDDSIIGIVLFGDHYFNMSDIIYDIDNDIEKDKIFDWYDYTLNEGLAGRPIINYKNWLKL